MKSHRMWTAKGLLLSLLALNVGLSQSQSIACPAFSAQAIDLLSAACATLDAGQGCTVEEGVLNLSETDLINLIGSESSAPLALLSLNAGLSEGRRIDFVLYGGVALQAVQSEAPRLVTMQVTNTAGYALNLRRGLVQISLRWASSPTRLASSLMVAALTASGSASGVILARLGWRRASFDWMARSARC